MEQLESNLETINNQIKSEKFFLNYKEDIKFQRLLEIISEYNNNIQTSDSFNKQLDEKIYNSTDYILTIIFKVGIQMEKESNLNNNKLRKSIDVFIEQTMKIIKILKDKNYKCIEEALEKSEYIDYITSQPFTIKILYDILKITLSNQNVEEKPEEIKINHKGSFSLIIKINEYLIKEANINNINDIIHGTKNIVSICEENISIISDNFLVLLKIITDLYNPEKNISNLYEELFSFFFNNLDIKENSKQKYNNKFIEILFELYKYLLEKRNMQIINIFLIKFFSSFSINYFGDEKGQISLVQRYEWLLQKTEYKRIILESLPEVVNGSIFAIYSTALINLINPSNIKNGLLPEEDTIIFFKNFERYLKNKNIKKEIFIFSFTKKICEIINYNIALIDVILQKCNIFNIIMKLIDTEEEHDVKIKLIELMENILSLNANDSEYGFEIEIRKDINDDINYRINKFTVGYELDDEKYNKKIGNIISLINERIKNKKLEEVIKLAKFIFEIISEYQFKKINVLSEDNITNFNNMFQKISDILYNPDASEINNIEKDLEKYAQNFLSLIFQFTIKLNSKMFDYKLMNYKMKKVLYFTQRIIKKKTLKYIINKLLLSKNDSIRNKTLKYLLFISIDEKNNLITSSYFLYLIINIYYQEKDYKSIQKMVNILLNLIKTFEVNIQILLYYDFMTINLNILEELNGKGNEYEDCYNTVFNLIKEISKYFNQNVLMNYLNKVFVLFKKNVLNKIKEQDKTEMIPLILNENERHSSSLNKNDKDDSNEEGKMKEDKLEQNINKKCRDKLYFDLLEILGKNLNNVKEKYLILSNYTFPNHLINNILFFDNLKFKAELVYGIGFKLTLKVTSYKGLNGFILLKLIQINKSICFFIENTSLIIKEDYEESEKILMKIDNFEKILIPDDKYHNIIVNFINIEKTFEMRVDNEIIINKNDSYFKNSISCDFSAIIGFIDNSIIYEKSFLDNKLSKIDNNLIENKITEQKCEDICFIYISHLLIINSNIEEKISKNGNLYSLNPSLLNYCFLKDKTNFGKFIISEIDFQNENTNISLFKNKNNKLEEINDFFHSNNENCSKKYISYKKIFNCFNLETSENYIYMISKNDNISEFCALNAIWELEKINKSNIASKLFDNYNIKDNLNLSSTIDFLFGFFFLIEKRFNELRDISKENCNQQECGLILTYEDKNMIIEYISKILEIIFFYPREILKDYFSENNILKLKFFIYRNIILFKTSDNFENKILEKFSKKELLLITFISDILFDINIFDEFDSEVQNIIINYLFKFLEKYELQKENKEMLNCINKLFVSIFNLIFFTELYKETMDILLNCIDIIISKLSLMKLVDDFTEKIFDKMADDYSGLEIEIKNHLNQEILQKYNYIFYGENNKDETYIEQKLNKLGKQITLFYNTFDKYANINSIMKKYKQKIVGIVKEECSFCSYIKKLFYLKCKFIYDENTYIKLYKRFFRNYYQNFGDNLEIFRKNSYAWFLSLKESKSKMQNKFFLKENLIKQYTYKVPNKKIKAKYFKYVIDEGRFKQKLKNLNKLLFYDQICKHDNLIRGINPNLELEKDNYFNCLIINKLRKIFSTFILYKDRIVIYYNICLDENNNIHIIKNGKNSNILWTKTQKDFNDELHKLIEENEKIIKKDIYNNKEKKEKTDDSNENISEFNYDEDYKFSFKVLYLNKINEIIKKDHLHFPNSLEIFLENGESYFIVLNPETREIIFDKIISNIDGIYKAKPRNKISIFKTPKIQALTNKENLFYMKHTPLSIISQSEIDHFCKSNNIKKIDMNKFSNIKSIIDINAFKDEIFNYWFKYRISNYDYIMLLNTLSGRSLNDLSQYFIFPWIIKDFDKDILNWMNNFIYRDLSLPIYACGNDLEKIKENYELVDMEDKYHSGTFYSTHNFVCYFLVRLHPFTEIHLEIQGSIFDTRARMFNQVNQLSEIKEKSQELIPHLFYLPELYIKLNYILEDKNSDEEIINDFILPSWSKDDPRKFTLILRKLLESEKISKNINHWIDLIFGYQQRGPPAEKALNTYRENVNYPSKAKLEKLKKSGEIESYLYEKEELGYIGKQVFTKQHKSRDNNSENIKNKLIFFNSDEKIKRLNIKKIKDNSNPLKKLNFNKCNDIIFPDNYSISILKFNRPYYQGGISSLSDLMNISEEQINDKIKKEKPIKPLEEDKNFFILKNKYYFLKKFCLILTYKSKFIELINIKECESKFYLLNEHANISCLTINSKGTKIFVGFSNGYISQYKLNILSVYNENNLNEFIMPKYQCQLDENIKSQNDIFINSVDYFLKEGINGFNIYLKLIRENNFNDNNPHLLRGIILLELNEAHNVLIALDQENIIYIISLNNNYKLMHRIPFLSKYHFNNKEIISLEENGDFIIYSSYTINLFNINGVPLCSLNLLEKENDDLYKITCCKAVFIYDVILFTAHKNGCIIIWKIINKDSEKNLYSEYNNKEYLQEYKYGYNFRNYMNSGIKLNKVELRRKFAEIWRREFFDNKKSKSKNNYFTFMKMSNDMNYMILLDNEGNMYKMTSSDNNEKKKGFFHTKTKLRQKCLNCGKEIIDFGIKPSLVQTIMDDDLDHINKININSNQKIDNDKDVICEECEQKLRHTENFLYTY